MGQILNKIISSSNNNLETFSLLWLDSSVNTTQENIAAQEELRATIHQLKTYSDPNECERGILSWPTDDRIVLIVSGQLGRQVVPRIHSVEQLVSIYVYCQNQALNEQWSIQFIKVKAVVTTLQELITRIHFDHGKRQQTNIYEPLPISIFDPKLIHEKMTTDLEGNLVHSQLLINCLLGMKSDVRDKNELISLSERIYRKNRQEMKIINEFKQSYDPQFAIWWYTRGSFISRLLNKALWTQNIDILFLFQFFIVDIRQLLEKHRYKTTIKAYRSQLISRNQFKKLKSSVGQFISINSFLSATIDFQRARSQLDCSDNLERVLFSIDADPQFSDDKPFASIESLSYDQQEEILFTLGSIFQIVKVSIDNEGIWIVQLQLCSNNIEQFDSNSDKNQLLSFGHVLMTIGKLDEAKVYYDRLCNALPNNHPDQARCYEALGNIADEQNDYKTSLEFYHNSLQINMQTLGRNHPDNASNYNSIGQIHQKLGDHNKALEAYRNALAVVGENPVGKGLVQKAISLNNIGIVYQDQKQYKEALDYYMKAFTIRKEHLAWDETSLGMSYNNIGNAYYFLKLYDDAIYYYQEALKIYRRTLPQQHPKVASTYNNLGAIYDNLGKLKEALEFYENAYKMYCSIYTTTHPNVIKIKENIERIESIVKT